MASDVKEESVQSSTKIADPPVKIIKAAVDDLYHFRDHYFENHDVEKAAEKIDDITEQLKKTLKIIDEHRASGEKENRAHFYLQHGRALNVVPHFDQEAYELLSKSVKLDFKLTDAWNELGDCYWKKGDMQGAKNCFEGALQKSHNKVSLRNLSMVLRQLGDTRDEKQKNVLDGITKAKEAVNLDINDGTSWSILGNAYLTAFFTLGQNPKLLKQCMAAYQQAEKDPVALNNPDLHYNHAMAFKYEESYQQALDGFCQTQKLDPSWADAKQKEIDLITYLQKVQTLIDNKGQLKSKRLQTFVESLQSSNKQLGPYGGGKYTGPSGQTISLQYVPLSELQAGLNSEKVVLGKVVCNVSCDDPVPFTFCMVDKDSTCFSVTVYNLAQGNGVIIGDSVAIPEPYVQGTDIKRKAIVINFKSIRVDSPMVLVVNGKKVGLDKHAPSEIGFLPLSH